MEDILLANSVTGYDAGFLNWSIMATPGKYFKLLLFRLLDVAPKILGYALLWYADMAWMTAVVVFQDPPRSTLNVNLKSNELFIS